MNNEAMAKTIEAYLKEKDWTFEYDRIHGVFSVEAELECKLGAALVVYQAKEDGFLCYTTIGENAAPEIRAAVGEYLHRANYGLPNGNFEFDYDDGSIHYKTYFDCPSGVPTQKQLDDSMAIGLTLFDHYGDGLYELLRGGSQAKMLIDRSEQQEG